MALVNQAALTGLATQIIESIGVDFSGDTAKKQEAIDNLTTFLEKVMSYIVANAVVNPGIPVTTPDMVSGSTVGPGTIS